MSLQEKIISKTVGHMDVVLKGCAGRYGIFKTLHCEKVADFAADPHETSYIVLFWWNKILLMPVKTGKLKCIF